MSRSTVVCAALLAVSLCLFPTVPSSQGQLAAQNVQPYGNCAPPQTAGVRICAPFTSGNATTIASPFQFIAYATGARGPVSNMQIWVDGVKVKQASGNVFDAPVTLSSGTHQATVVEVDTTGEFLKSTPISISIQNDTSVEPCPRPNSPGVNVCLPAGNSCHTAAWTTIVASATASSGSVARMELWANGVKLANFPGSTINTNLFLADFTTVTIVEVDTSGRFLKSAPIVLQSC